MIDALSKTTEIAAPPTDDTHEANMRRNIGERTMRYYRREQGSSGERLVPSSQSDQFFPELNDAIRPLFESIVYPDGREGFEAYARAFVQESTGLTPTHEVNWTQSPPGADKAGMFLGFVGRSFVHEKGLETPEKFIQSMSSLIHEFAHDTGDQGQTVVIETQSQNSPVSDFEAHDIIGSEVLSLKKVGNHIHSDMRGMFFEEAFAEGTATRWREKFFDTLSPDINTQIFTLEAGISMPARYFSLSPLDTTNIRHTASTFAAYGMDVLQQHTTTDLYRTMTEIRTPATRASAKKTFIHTLDSIQPGLYKTLRDLRNNEAEFKKGLEIIQAIKAD